MIHLYFNCSPLKEVMDLRTFSNNFEQYDCQLKVVLIGQSMTGKTSLMTRFVKDKFIEDSQCTVGSAFMSKVMQIEDNRVKFEIWDTAGSERYEAITPMYYRNSNVILVVYDITSVRSMVKAEKYIEEIKSIPDVVIALVGNKYDEDEFRTVEIEDALDYAQKHNLIYMETSAKTGHNVNELFREVGSRFPAQRGSAYRENFILGPLQGEPYYSNCCNN